MDIRKDNDGELDEIVARNCTVHLEKLDEKQWWIQIVDADGNEARIEIYNCQLVWDCQTRDAQLRIGADDAGQDCPDCGGSGYIVDEEGNEQQCLLCL